PILLVNGFIGNLLTLVILLSEPTRRRVSALYLVVLAAADLCSLVFGLIPIWIEVQFGIALSDRYTVPCKVRKLLHYVSSDMSVWLICAFTVDRTIAVMLPHRMKIICTKRRARMTTGLILVLALAKNLSVVITRTLEADPLTNRTKC
ncbi:hypothetical protein CAPTEDRAFT_28579, partial [Capitella teleta]